MQLMRSLVTLFLLALMAASPASHSMLAARKAIFRCVCKGRALYCQKLEYRGHSPKYYPSLKELHLYMDNIVKALEHSPLRGPCQMRADSLAYRMTCDFAPNSLELKKHFIDWRPVGWNGFNYHAFIVVDGFREEEADLERFALDPFWSPEVPVLPLSDFVKLFAPGNLVIRPIGWDIMNFDLMDPGPRFNKRYEENIKRGAEKLKWQ